MKQDKSSSTAYLIQLCVGYFVFYVMTGILVKYFTAIVRMPEMKYLFNNTLGGSVFALGVVLIFGWIKLKSNRYVQWGPFRVPSEVAYIIPSGICTAIVIPTTTLMYSLPISVMVAMVIMRGSIIVISRLVDQVQIQQGILKKRVYREENLAVVFALLAVATNVLLLPLADFLEGKGVHVESLLGIAAGASRGSFDFLHSTAAVTILSLYVGSYAIRLYIMNFYKNTRAKGVEQDNKGFFAIEQVSAFVAMVGFGMFFFFAARMFGWSAPQLTDYHDAVLRPEIVPILSGVPFGVVAFFSVFLFMFKGRTATFAGLVNRLTSLLAGTTATLLTYFIFKTRFPSVQDWVSVVFILIAVYFLSRAEKLRVAELQAARAAAESREAGGAPGVAAAGGSARRR